MTNEFPEEVRKSLKYYVYRLIDPRNGETFYIGKGKNNRVFEHIRGNIDKDELSEKMSRIRDISVSGFEVAHVIHRHGMDEETALEVEAALIDAYPGLTNIMDGQGNSEFGAMHADEIMKRYAAETVEFKHKALLISINRSATERSLYSATKLAWRLNREKASSAEVVLPTIRGLIVGAFIADKWMEATKDNFPELDSDIPKRYGFIGTEAPEDIKTYYVGKKIPERYRKKGASNPIKYTW